MSNKQRVQPQITFDEFNRLRILDAEHAKHTESLAEDSKLFIDSQTLHIRHNREGKGRGGLQQLHSLHCAVGCCVLIVSAAGWLCVSGVQRLESSTRAWRA